MERDPGASTGMSPTTAVMVPGDAMTPTALVQHVQRLEELGYPSAWITDVFGREIYVTAAHLLANTSSIKIASGIAHIYGRDALASEQAGRTLSELSGGRFIQGLGVSHPVAAQMRGLEWENPVSKMRDYVMAMRAELPLHTPANAPHVPIYIAAHGPKMMALAAEVADGANTYMQPPEHTAASRATLGPDKDLTVVLPSCLTADPEVGRAAGRRALSIYLPLPAYQRQWRTHGFNEDDWADGGSDRLVDAYINWGDIDSIRSRMNAHVEAGATGIALAALPGDPSVRGSAWELLEAAAPGR
jgi:probable F420-dependent oxidoreductase